jgi:DNA-binding transcriptional LysR family regulator
MPMLPTTERDGSPVLDLDLLRVFVTAAERGGFTRAARSLHRTQSAVSAQVKRLEDAVGAELFLRGSREVRLTPAGERLIGHARRLLALGDEALALVATQGEAGTVRLGCVDDYATRILPGLLAGFWRANPGVLVEVRTGLTTHLLERLGGELDLVLGMLPAGSPRVGEALGRDRPLWAAAPAAGLEHEPVLPLALYPEGCLFRRWAIDALDRQGRPWRCAYLSPSLAAVEEAVRAGLAVSVFKTRTVAPDLQVLGPEQGFPALPEVEMMLRLAPGGVSRVVTGLAAYLMDQLGDRAPACPGPRLPALAG